MRLPLNVESSGQQQSYAVGQEKGAVAKRVPRKLGAEVARLFDEAETLVDQGESERALALCWH
jgi:hypothetical protein